MLMLCKINCLTLAHKMHFFNYKEKNMKKVAIFLGVCSVVLAGNKDINSSENEYEIPVKQNIQIITNTPQNRLSPNISDDGSTITEYVRKSDTNTDKMQTNSSPQQMDITREQDGEISTKELIDLMPTH